MSFESATRGINTAACLELRKPLLVIRFRPGAAVLLPEAVSSHNGCISVHRGTVRKPYRRRAQDAVIRIIGTEGEFCVQVSDVVEITDGNGDVLFG